MPAGGRWTASVLGRRRAFCCPGCQAVCRAIVDAGLEDYYRHRERPAGQPAPLPPETDPRLALYDRPEIQRSFVQRHEQGLEAALILENIRCAACLWLNEQHLRRLEGILDVQIDYASARAWVRWDPDRVKLSEILRAVAEIGYIAHPYDATHRRQLLREQKQRNAERLIFAGLLGMAVMHFSLAGYLMGQPAPGEGLPLWVILGRWTALLATTAILAYPAQEFFLGAWRALRHRRLGMDVPIAIGLAAAYLGSLVATVRQTGEVYFDSVAMFVFFILLARRLELRGRLAAAGVLDTLARIVPRTARRLAPDGDEETVAVVDLAPGDRLRLRPGERVPVDGIVEEGVSSFDESALTGEAAPRRRQVGEAVSGGARNVEQAVVLRVTRSSDASAISVVQRLLAHGLRSRPPVALLADQAAAWFVRAVLLIAALTAGAWLWLEPEAALANTVAVLIVTCPCALALATPAALAIGAGRFAASGVLPLRLEAVERLARSDAAAFDKTGTLTRGRLQLVSVQPFAGLTEGEAVRYARALEQHCEHPIAKALARAGGAKPPTIREQRQVAGAGVSAVIGGQRWTLGSPAFVLEGSAPEPAARSAIDSARAAGHTVVALADATRLRALFTLQDEVRAGLADMFADLRAQGLVEFGILTGDHQAAAQRLADTLGIREVRAGMAPDDKLNWIKHRQQAGRRVMMVGDGINDAPTLAAASVSFSFAHATELAQSSSDFIVLSQDIGAIAAARRLAVRIRRVILQNLLWASSYNLLALPAAALGWIPPWAAAIGMSLSSLLVVANALRLRRYQTRRTTQTETVGSGDPWVPIAGAEG